MRQWASPHIANAIDCLLCLCRQTDKSYATTPRTAASRILCSVTVARMRLKVTWRSGVTGNFFLSVNNVKLLRVYTCLYACGWVILKRIWRSIITPAFCWHIWGLLLMELTLLLNSLLNVIIPILMTHHKMIVISYVYWYHIPNLISERSLSTREVFIRK